MIDLSSVLPVNPNRTPERRALNKIKKIVVHCSDGNGTPESIAKMHVTPGPQNGLSKKGAPTCAYHFMISRDGVVYQCVDDKIITWHASGYNSESVSVCLIYRTKEDWEKNPNKAEPPGPQNKPTDAQMSSLEKLLKDLLVKYNLSSKDVFGHRELKGTGFLNYFANGLPNLIKTCPGRSVNLDDLRSKLSK